jgi:hypothetical protein
MIEFELAKKLHEEQQKKDFGVRKEKEEILWKEKGFDMGREEGDMY